jgi:pimeloyl-ACP methyl ester carboxylesterase
MPTESAQLHVDDAELGDLVFDAVVAGPDDGEPVLLLHGWPQTALSWSQVIPPLAASGLRVAAVDQRGYSAGARPTTTEAYAVDRLVEDVSGILDALGWGTAHIVGHDWGAAVAWNLAARRPGLVRSLTALSVPHPRAQRAAYASDERQRELSSYMTLFRGDPTVAAQRLLADDAAYLRSFFGTDVSADDVEAYVEFLSDDSTLEATLRWYAAMGLGQSTPLPDVDVATTYVWGSEDLAISETAALGCAEYCLGEYEFRRLDGRGHWLPDQDPAAVVDAILGRVG